MCNPWSLHGMDYFNIYNDVEWMIIVNLSTLEQNSY